MKERKMTVHICQYCNKEFMARSDSPTKYCSKECRTGKAKMLAKLYHHVCEYCGKEFESNRVEARYCSRQCSGKAIGNARIKNIRICPICNKEFHAQRKKIIYCSPQCGLEARTTRTIVHCDLCGKEIVRTQAVIKKNKHNFCSKKHYDEWLIDHHEKKGVLVNNGIYHHGQGYIFHYQSSKNYKAEHRLVMEQCLGRPLRSDEIVHHKDGNKQNNDISNLEIVTRAEHIEIHRSELLEAREKARRRGKNV